MNRRIMSILSMVLVLCMLFSSVTVYANSEQVLEENGIRVIALGCDRFQVNDNGNISYIEIRENSSLRTVVKIIDTTGECTVLSLDKARNTITSSRNDEVINVLDCNGEIDEEWQVPDRYAGEIRYKYISYAQIKNALGGTATVAGVAGIIVLILTAAGFAVPGMIPTITTLLGGITGLIASVMNGSPNHGLKITLKCYLKTVHHGNDTAQVEVWKVTGISTY